MSNEDRTLGQNIDQLYHPEKGIVKSNNERRRCNKFPNEDPIANHNIAGTSRKWAETVYTGAVSPTKTFRPPNNTDKFINETDRFGVPNYWSVDGQLIVSHAGSVLCNYCGVPSHSRDKCKLKMQDEAEGRSYNIHPNRGKILSNNQATKQLQPAKGVSYKPYKKHSYYDEVWAQLLKTHSQQITNPKEENIGWDYNHNPPFQGNKHLTRPIPGPKAKIQPEAATPRKLAKYRAKWATEENIAEIPQDNQNRLSNMPAEILERILAYLSFKQRISVQRTNQRFREITLTPKLWKNITIRGHLITNPVMLNILRRNRNGKSPNSQRTQINILGTSGIWRKQCPYSYTYTPLQKPNHSGPIRSRFCPTQPCP